MRNRLRLLLVSLLSLVVATTALAASPGSAAATGEKVVIIVGPTGDQTDYYRNDADSVAAAATAAGATAVKVYSPNATWANVKSAVEGANVIVFMGHGNGFPSPYSDTENTDRVNGWGLNRTTTNGDDDNWSSTMAYCGEKALLGTLTGSDGAAQWSYCGGSNGTQGINPAPGFVMIYAHACYTPGAGEARPAPSQGVASARVANYSYPVLQLGAGAYFATDYGDSAELVQRLLLNPQMSFGEAFQAGVGYSPTDLRTSAHPDLANDEVWIQKTNNQWLGTDYWYAFAGDPSATFSGAPAEGAPQVTKVGPRDGAGWFSTTGTVRAWFDVPVSGVSRSSFTLTDSFGFRVPAKVRWNGGQLKAVLVPSHQLVPREWYTATLSSAIRSAEGVPMATFRWRFKTRNDGDGTAANWPKTKRLAFRMGTHSAYQFDADGRMTSIKTSTLPADSGANTSTRRMLPNQSGFWFYVTNGLWAGHWIRQSDALYLADDPPGGTDTADQAYDPPVRLSFLKGTHTGYKFGSSGEMLAQKTYTLSRNSGADASSLEAISNQTGSWFKVVNGVWAGYWIRASDVVYLP